MAKFNKPPSRLCRGGHLFFRTMSRSDWGGQFLQNTPSLGRHLSSQDLGERGKWSCGRWISSFSLSCWSSMWAQEKPSSKVLLQVVCLLVPSHVMRGAQSICLQQHLGAGRAGEEWGAGEDHAVGRVLLAGSSFCLGWWVWECAMNQGLWITQFFVCKGQIENKQTNKQTSKRFKLIHD